MKKQHLPLTLKLDELASLFEYGELMQAANPVAFIDNVIQEIKDLRKFRDNCMAQQEGEKLP